MLHRFAPALSAGACLAALVAGSASAQEVASTAIAAPELGTPPDEDVVDEVGTEDQPIVVTARRREERAQDVPIALSVVGGEALAARGDYRLDQVQQLVPSLQVFSFNPRNTNINIRGLGSNVALTNDGIENGVGLYIDGVYYGRVGQSQFDLVDLDRIEVLRGPQGTLFGKNTTAGAINISSRLPSTSGYEYSAEATVGDYGYHQLRGSASGPIVDGLLAARVSIADTHRDGFIENVTTGRKVHDYDNFTLRAQLLITPAEALSIRLIGDYSKQEQHCCINLPVSTFTTYENGAAIANNFDQRAARLDYTPLPLDPFARRTDANSHFQANMNTGGFSGEISYDFGGATLTSITAWREWNWFPANDSDYTSLSVNLQNQQQNFQRQFSQEVRLGSNGSRSFDWVIGAYYFWQVIRGYGTAAYGADAPRWLFPADPIAVSDAAVNGFVSKSQSDPHTRSIAGFGQAVWHIDPRLSLTVGLRFTHEDKWGGYSSRHVAGQSLAGLTPAQATRAQAIRTSLNPQQSFEVDASDDSFSWLGTLAWKPSEDVLLYATWSRGSKSKGINLTNLPAIASPVVEPEETDNFEAGIKSQFFDRKLTFNLAGYWTNVSNYQTTIVQQVIGTNSYVNYIANIPKARSRGFEADLAWQAARWASFTGSVAYTDATYVDYPVGPTPVERLNPTPAQPGGFPQQDMSGERLAGVPEWSASLGGDLWTPLTRDAEGYVHADWSWRSEYYTVASNSRYGLVPGYDLVNLRLGVRLEDGKADLSVWARNLFDRDYYQTLGVVNYGLVTATIGDPRTIGVTLRTRW
ncbi:TonB-dependent receptor [Sphingomonas sp. DT-207]|uniref:TonB-dependent receptor n=1 Tax=Sphingomonas sp. DT-207 TaxID=3396167 RepID=UPI003F1DB0F0